MFSTNSRRPEGGAVHLFMEEKDMIKTIITALVLLVVGFILLVKGADFFVEGSASVAKKLKIPSLVIGMTIVAMGTSLPECSVSIIASLNESNSLSISNAVGSNIFNLMVVCGICTLFIPLEVAKDTIKRDFPFSIACTLLLLFTGYTSMTLGRTEGIVFLVCFAFFILIMVKSAMKSRKISNEAMQEIDEELEEISEDLSGIKCLLYIVGGAIAIKFGGDFVVNGATSIARTAGVTETVIGLTIVALGTSLPELVTSIVAARKKEVDMAVGNVIGSNIFNILMVLGIAATISPITFLTENIIDIIVLVVFSGLVWAFAWTKKQLDKKEGIIMLVLYAIYTVYIIMR